MIRITPGLLTFLAVLAISACAKKEAPTPGEQAPVVEPTSAKPAPTDEPDEGRPSFAHDFYLDEESVREGLPEEAEGPSYSPYVGETFPKNVYWGDTHLHTSNSFDAGFANFRVGPEEAYRFARGEEITANNGMAAKLVRPLDWLVVSDHAEYLGITPGLRAKDPRVLKTEEGRRWADAIEKGEFAAIYQSAMEVIRLVMSNDDSLQDAEFTRSIWKDASEIADRMNQPGLFTAFIGFEWTSMPGGRNLHRVVIFGDGADRTTQVLPFSLFDSEDPEDLWAYMDDYEKKTGGSAVALAHNGNLSNGAMFAVETLKGEPLSRDYAATRMRWEPIYEVTQIKGDGETHLALSPDDEFADYGTWDKGDIVGIEAKKPEMLPHEYARSALKLGLKLEAEIGVNPFKFGLVGSTDSHTGLATANETNFFGKASHLEPDNEKRAEYKILESPVDESLTSYAWEQVAGGLAAVWASENTRKDILDAMRRKEVYATTGSRMTVRFFGGWDFTNDDLQAPRPAKTGYARGVPMGGDLSSAPKGKPASFLVWAAKDPDGANLDRIQIVKGWLDTSGKLNETVYDVAWSGNRKRDKGGKLPTVGNTVDVKDASYRNSIGLPMLATAWTDPDFDPNERAFYYVRVIEIPTPTWTAYDAKRLVDAKLPEGDSGFHQERAYTSPIWYTP